LSASDNIGLSLSCDIKDDAPEGNYVIRFSDSLFVDIADKNLSTAVYPILSGMSYPVYGAEISLAAAGLENSFSNYPNPFNPARGQKTTIAFTLTDDAYIDIEIFTVTGDEVRRIAVNDFRESGTHQTDTWSGANGIGQPVIPGTYYCRITARYVSGRTESFKRKIAVVR
jgi:hypothetical protein